MELPAFFEELRSEAAGDWDVLEEKQSLARPWRVLFNEVQDPRHVISELLQNADDAGATWVTTRVEDGDFVFEHNGHDFTREESQSLCRFRILQ
jgi:hypothetical protein